MTRKSLLLSLSVLASILILGHSAYVQADLTSFDVGDAADLPGTTDITADGAITVVGAGHDVWGAADGFRYVYTEVSGDFDAIVQISFFERPAGEKWAKAGLMARQSTDPGAKNALSTAAAGEPGDELGVQITWRPETDGETDELNFWELGGPSGFNDGEWIRLTRSGNDFSVSWSDDGVAWADDYAAVPIEMNDPILVGLAVTATNTGIFCEAVYENFTIDGESVFSSAAVSSDGKLSATWAGVKAGL